MSQSFNPAERDILVMDVNAGSIAMLKEQHRCPYFRILVIGRANAGKTTILEKVCGVAQGTQPAIFDGHGHKLKANTKEEPIEKSKFKLALKGLFPSKPSVTHLTPSAQVSCKVKHMNLHPLIYNQFQRGIHNIEHQMTYSGSNFIFHDSQGFEAGTSKELEVVWKFIEERSIAAELKDQLHAIWYLISVLCCWMTKLFVGIVYLWTALVLFCPQNLSFSIKEQGKACPIF